jgi:hypothetical protein
MKCLFRRVEFSLDAATLTFQLHWLLVLVIFHLRFVWLIFASRERAASMSTSNQCETLLRQALMKLLLQDTKRLGRRGRMLSLLDPQI